MTAVYCTMWVSPLLLPPALSMRILLIGSVHSSGHRLFIDRTIDVLQNKLGHDVSLLSARDNDNINTKINIDPAKEYSIYMNTSIGQILSYVTFTPNITMRQMMPKFGEMNAAQTACCSEAIRSEGLAVWLRAVDAELVIAYPFDMCPNVLVELELITPNMVLINPGCYMFETAAIPQRRFVVPSYIPHAFGEYSDVMSTLRVRAANSLRSVIAIVQPHLPFNILFSPVLLYDQVLHEVDDTRSVLSSASTAPGIVINGDTLIEFPRPITGDMHFLADTLFAKADDARLPADWEELVEGSQQGVIVCSFGTTIDLSSMPSSFSSQLAEALSSPALRRYTVVWKFDTKRAVDVSSNVHIVGWLPQMALLRHPRTVLFITHCGYNSMYETLQSGTPMVIIPLFIDQLGNALRVHRLTGAPVLDKKTMTPDDIVTAVRSVLRNDTITQRAHHVASMMSTRVSPSIASLDIFLQHMRHRWRSGRVQGRALYRLSLAQSLGLDLAMATVIVLVILLTLVI